MCTTRVCGCPRCVFARVSSHVGLRKLICVYNNRNNVTGTVRTVDPEPRGGVFTDGGGSELLSFLSPSDPGTDICTTKRLDQL